MASFRDLLLDLKENCISVREDEENIRCIIESEENYEKFARKLKIAGISFSNRTTCAKRDGKLVYSNQKIGIDFFGFPFTVVNHQRFECVNGPLKMRKAKQIQEQSEDEYPKTNKENIRTRRRRDTRKIGCTATMKISTIKYFPSYRIDQHLLNIHDRKIECMRRLKTDLQKNEADIAHTIRFYVSMSHPTTHSHSLWSSLITQQLDESLKAEIKRLVYEDSITDVLTVKYALKNYVTCNFSASIPQENRAFFPSNRTVYNFILKYVNELKSKGRQINPPVFRSRKTVEPEPDHYEPEPIQDVSLTNISVENLKQSAQELLNVLCLIPETANSDELGILNELIIDCKNVAQRVVIDSEENLVIIPDEGIPIETET